MELQVGDKVKYTFPLNNSKTVNATIEFKGQTIIHLKSDDGIKIKVQWINFDLIEPNNEISTIFKN